jgi:hypothetical protein
MNCARTCAVLGSISKLPHLRISTCPFPFFKLIFKRIFWPAVQEKIEKISWTDRVRHEEVLLRVNEQRNILHEISKRKAKWIGYILRRNCFLRQVIEWKIKGGIEVTGRRERRRRKLLDDLKERRGYSHLKEEAVDRTMWRTRFGRGFGPVVRQIAKWMNEWYKGISNSNRDIQQTDKRVVNQMYSNHYIQYMCLHFLWRNALDS